MARDYSKNIVVDEKDHPYTGTNYAWVRARVLGGKTAIWGRLALRLSDHNFKAASRDGYGVDWPISYKDIEPYYDKVDLYLGISGVKEGIDHLPDSLFQRPVRLTPAEVKLRKSIKKMGRVLTPYRAGVTTDGLKHNKYRTRCYGRGACNRRAGGCDIHAAFDSPTGLIYPAMDTGNLTLRTNSVVREVLVDTDTGKAKGVAFVDSVTKKEYEVRAKVVVLAASTLESARLLMLSKSRQHPNGLGNSSGHVGHNFCEHVMGPSVFGLVKDLVGNPRTNDDGKPGSFYVPRFSNWTEKNPNFIRGYGFEGGSGTTMMPTSAFTRPGFGASYKKDVRDYAGAYISMGGFGEVLARYENYVETRSGRQGRVGNPGAPLPIPVQRQREAHGRGHGGHGKGNVRSGWNRDPRREQEHPHGGMVDPRARNGSHGRRSEDQRSQSVPAVARRQKPVRRRRQQPRERLESKPDVDDHGARLAVLRVPRRPAQEGEPVMTDRDDSEPMENEGHSEETEITRRSMIKLTVGRCHCHPVRSARERAHGAGQAASTAAYKPKFLTQAEFALADELAELIIPTDDVSPGARAAGVIPYLDGRLAETQEPGEQEEARGGLAAFDDAFKKSKGKSFVEASAEERVAFLTDVSKNELDAKTPEEKFFRGFKTAVAAAYYSSEIGIHKDIGYLGNSYLDEFVGYDVSQEEKA